MRGVGRGGDRSARWEGGTICGREARRRFKGDRGCSRACGVLQPAWIVNDPYAHEATPRPRNNRRASGV